MASQSLGRSLLIKPASGDCNLHCQYCFYHDRESDPYKKLGQRHRMSPEVLEEMIKQAMQLDRRQATFGWQGGEPTLAGLEFFQQVVALQQKYGAAGQAVSNGLQTNSLLLDPEWARFLRQYNFLVGISLDGPPEYHDRYRIYSSGAPTHAKVMEKIRMLRQYGVEFNILSVVNDVTGDHGAEIYDYLVSQGFRYLQFIPCVETDPTTGEIADFSVGPEQLGDFLCEVFDRWYNDGEPVVSVRDFEAHLAVYLGQVAPMCSFQKECGSYLVVEYNGDLYPCDFLVREDLYMGNLLETPLSEVFESKALKHFKAQKAVPRPECQACRWLPLCNQGCYRFVNLDGSGRHYLCRAYQRFFAYSHERFTRLADRILTRMGVDPKQRPKPPIQTIGRNDPCPCGSGKKYKNCCGRRVSRS